MSFKSIDQSVVLKQTIEISPFAWCKFENLIHPHYQTDLLEQYPSEHLQYAGRLEGEKKNYQFNVSKLISENRKTVNTEILSPLWQDFIEEISSPAYLTLLFNLFNISAKNTKIDIGLFRFAKGDWVEPHVDHEDKLLTQLFYFNEGWNEKWGGLLLLHEGKEPNRVFDYCTPCQMHSIAIKRMHNAWHSVTPVTQNAKQDRLTLQLEIWKS